jgi:hypothetical protein
VPSLINITILSLYRLPALQTLSFGGPLFSGYDKCNELGPSISIHNTSLSHIDGLSFPSASGIQMSSNRNLSIISFPLLTVVYPSWTRGPDGILVYDNGNGDEFVLHLPKLEHAKGYYSTRNLNEVRVRWFMCKVVYGGRYASLGVSAVNVPELQFIDGDLDIGAFRGEPDPPLSNSTHPPQIFSP